MERESKIVFCDAYLHECPGCPNVNRCPLAKKRISCLHPTLSEVRGYRGELITARCPTCDAKFTPGEWLEMT
jgi:hypothetical protein